MCRPSRELNQLLIQCCQGLFLGRLSGRGVMLTTHLHLVPRLRMSGAVPLLSYTPSRLRQGQIYLNPFLYLLPDIQRRSTRQAVHTRREIRNAYKIVFETPERKRPPFGRPTQSLMVNIKLDNRKGRMGNDYIHLAEERDQRRALVRTVTNNRTL